MSKGVGDGGGEGRWGAAEDKEKWRTQKNWSKTWLAKSISHQSTLMSVQLSGNALPHNSISEAGVIFALLFHTQGLRPTLSLPYNLMAFSVQH